MVVIVSSLLDSSRGRSLAVVQVGQLESVEGLIKMLNE